MKYLNIDTFEEMTDSELSDILLKRGRKVIKALREKVVGQRFQGFGPRSRGIWGKNTKPVVFTIKNVTADGVFTHTEKAGKIDDRAIVNLTISLENYNANTYGLLYTCVLAEKQLTQLFRKALGSKSAEVTWTEQGAQGQKTINVHLDMPLREIAPDVLLYQQYVEQTQDLEKELQKIRRKFDAKLETSLNNNPFV